MRFKVVANLEERFGTPKGRLRHYYDHGIDEYPGLTECEYEKLADELASKPVDNKRILGFQTNKLTGNDHRERHIKYDIVTNDFVVYSWEMGYQSPSIISLHKRTKEQYDKQKELHYEDEIPPWL